MTAGWILSNDFISKFLKLFSFDFVRPFYHTLIYSFIFIVRSGYLARFLHRDSDDSFGVSLLSERVQGVGSPPLVVYTGVVLAYRR